MTRFEDMTVRMRLHHLLVCLAMAAAFLTGPAWSQAPVPAPALAAKAWYLVDTTSGQVLVAESADQRMEPAALTKLMTAYVAFAAVRQGLLKLDQAVAVPDSILKRVSKQEARTFLQPDLPVTVEELLKGVAVQSGNDAAIVLAEAVAGTEEAFVERMNRQARQLGLTNTQYRNVTGQSEPDHYSSARDIAVLAGRLIQDFPELYRYYALKDFSYNKVSQPNRNRLLWLDPTVDGMQTGQGESAGFCLAASGKRGDRRLLSVVLGAASDNARTQESLKLLNYGFQNFDTVRVYKKDDAVVTPEVWKGTAKQIRLGMARDVWLTVPKGQVDRLKPMLERRQPLVAPIQAGQEVGRMRLMLNDKPVVDLPVVALETVESGSMFGRAWDSIRLWFK